jgi:hypothetical protein
MVLQGCCWDIYNLIMSPLKQKGKGKGTNERRKDTALNIDVVDHGVGLGRGGVDRIEKRLVLGCDNHPATIYRQHSNMHL